MCVVPLARNALDSGHKLRALALPKDLKEAASALLRDQD